MSEDNTIHLWGTDGARAGSITLRPCIDPQMAIVKIDLAVCGLANFDFWWHKIAHDVHDILVNSQYERTDDDTDA